MGIHIHREGTPNNCGCCDIRERLMNLYDRTHAAVLDVNGITPDGDGHLVIPGIQDISDVREQVEDHEERIDDLEEGEQGLIAAVNQNAQDIQNTRQYADSIGENVASIDTEIHTTRPYVDINTEQTINAVKNISVIGNTSQSMINKDWIWKSNANADNGLIHRNGNETKTGDLSLTGNYFKISNIDSKVVPSGYENFGDALVWNDKNNVNVANIRRDRESAYDRIFISISQYKSASRTDTASLNLNLNSNGALQLILRKTVNGVSTSKVVDTL